MCFISEIRKANLIGHGAAPGGCAGKGPARRLSEEERRASEGGKEWGGG